MPLFDPSDHIACFIQIIKGTVQGDRFAVLAVRPEVFPQPVAVMGDQGVRRFQDIIGGTVVLFETDGGRAGEIFQETLDIFHLRAAPAVDRLIIITDNHHFTGIARQHAYPGILDAVGVLEFVHEDIGKTITIVL